MQEEYSIFEYSFYMIRIKELREEKEISQVELAKAVLSDQSAISKYERGELEPNLDTIKKLCKFFNVTSDYLLGIEND